MQPRQPVDHSATAVRRSRLSCRRRAAERRNRSEPRPTWDAPRPNGAPQLGGPPSGNGARRGLCTRSLEPNGLDPLKPQQSNDRCGDGDDLETRCRDTGRSLPREVRLLGRRSAMQAALTDSRRGGHFVERRRITRRCDLAFVAAWSGRTACARPESSVVAMSVTIGVSCAALLDGAVTDEHAARNLRDLQRRLRGGVGCDPRGRTSQTGRSDLE